MIMEDDMRTIAARHLAKPPLLAVLCSDQVKCYRLQGRQVLGRPTAKSPVQIPVAAKQVSRMHGEFFVLPEGTFFRDAGSTNGTYLNGLPVQPHSGIMLKHGDILRIRAESDLSEEVVMVFLQEYFPESGWDALELNDSIAEIEIGRKSGALTQSSPELSARHASFFLARRGWAVIDHQSTNGVFLNGQRIDRPKYLRPMDVIMMGGYTFFYTGKKLFCQQDSDSDGRIPEKAAAFCPEPSPDRMPERPVPVRRERDDLQNALQISIIERSVWNRMRRQTLLKDIHMEIPGGSMVLILGGSGAGKTTFMNAVMGYEQAKGKISYRGTDIYDEYEKMKYEIGYVPQEDLLRMGDRVWDTLMNAAQMRLPATASQRELEERVQTTLSLLGLERERDSFVRKLSGGQRKRLSIAVEYVGNPSLFFLDEPDSGLDGTMARSLMENLRQIADMGKIILVISHSPDRAFELWDKVIVLAKGNDNSGHLVFFGSPQEGCSFFGVQSLEQIVKKINRPDEGGEGRAEEFIRKYAAMGGKNG